MADAVSFDEAMAMFPSLAEGIDELYQNNCLVRALENTAAPNYEMAKEALLHGADANTLLADGVRLIDRASCTNRTDLVVFLVSWGADANSVTYPGEYAPLHRAISYFNLPLVKALLASGKSDPNRLCHHPGYNSNRWWITPLGLAVQADKLDMVGLLLDHGAHLAQFSPKGRPLLHLANSPQMISFLVQRGLDPNQIDNKKSTLLHKACRKCQMELVEELIRIGADANLFDKHGRTPFHAACAYGHADLAKWMLCKGGAELSLQTEQNESALVLAARCPDLVDWLLEYSCFGLDELYKTLCVACTSPNNQGGDDERTTRTVNALLRCNVELFFWPGPLHLAAAWNLNLCRLLVWFNSNARYQFKNGVLERPIHVAAREGSLEILDYFVGLRQQDGLTLDVRDANGATPLFHAVEKGRLDHAQTLVELGCNVNVINLQGHSILHKTILLQDSSESKRALMSLLVGRGADPTMLDDPSASRILEKLPTCRETPAFMCAAVTNSSIDIVFELIQASVAFGLFR